MSEQREPAVNSKPKRSIRNFLLQPMIQVKLGLYCILLAVAFAAGLAAIFYYNFGELVNSVVLMTDLEVEVRELFLEYWTATQLYVYAAFAAYLALTVLISVLYTHRLVGPTVAFRRFAEDMVSGKYSTRVYLRNGDAFREVADELNRLADKLEGGNDS